jgi:hypothetical protein
MLRADPNASEPIAKTKTRPQKTGRPAKVDERAELLDEYNAWCLENHRGYGKGQANESEYAWAPIEASP